MADITVRGDQTWNNSNKSFATVRWDHEDELRGDDFHNAFTGAYQHRMTRGSGIDHVWTISPNKILDLQLNLTRYEEPNNDHGVGFDPTTLGFPTSFTSQLFVPAVPRITGIFGDFGTNQAGSVTDTSYYTWAADLTHVKGNMTLKYGAEFWVLQQANKSIGNQGRFDFGSELDPPAGRCRRRHRRRLHLRRRSCSASRTTATAASRSTPMDSGRSITPRSTSRTTGASRPG